MKSADDTVAAHVVVVGDGPAGSALASALRRREVDVLLVGPDAEWPNTYGTWADDVERAEVLGGANIWLHRLDSIGARFTEPRMIERPYGVVDNRALRAVLRSGVPHERRTIRALHQVDARVVVDATGWPSSLRRGRSGHGSTDDILSSVAWQTAFGVVLADRPTGPLGAPMLMDFSTPPTTGSEPVDADVASFAYALPVERGWLVEETVLAASPAIDPILLVDRLAARLHTTPDDLRASAIATEQVRIPMGAPPVTIDGNVISFGAAGGMVHPATGYSIAAALCSATVVADRIANGLRSGGGAGGTVDRTLGIDDPVWSLSNRRTRVLHDFGLDVLLKMDVDGVRKFFDTFFDAPTEQWAAYLRIDAAPGDVAHLMTSMFRRADWSLRRQLLRSNPLALLRLARRSS